MSAPINNGGPAFPSVDYTESGEFIGCFSGMTLRDYFAAKALQASMSTACGASAEAAIEKAAETAYKVADAMLKAREA